MKKKLLTLFELLILLNLVNFSKLLSNDEQYEIINQTRFGINGGVSFGVNEAKTQNLNFSSGIFYRQPILKSLFSDISIGYFYNSGLTWYGKDYKTRLIPINLNLNYSPDLNYFLKNKNLKLYAIGGFGLVLFKIIDPSPNASIDAKKSGLVPMFTLGAGSEYAVAKNLSLDFHITGNIIFSDDLNGEHDNSNDGFWNMGLSLIWCMGDRNPDSDGDGLSDDFEKKIGTNPYNPDTDSDGLTDGEEYNIYKTNPLESDTDGDGLFDGLEVKKFKTDPLKIDTDGDGLSDGNEILKYHTDPLKFDTDSDGLSDGDEILKYHTDPLNKDTDRGSVDDGTEIKRGTDPLNKNDDSDTKKLDDFENSIGSSMIIYGLEFETESDEIISGTENSLNKILNILSDNKDFEIEIEAHVFEFKSKNKNSFLSQKRALNIKNWFIENGISSDRIRASGLGSDKPIDDNNSDENTKINTRIEIKRIK